MLPFLLIYTKFLLVPELGPILLVLCQAAYESRRTIPSQEWEGSITSSRRTY